MHESTWWVDGRMEHLKYILTPVLTGQILDPRVVSGVASLETPWILSYQSAEISCKYVEYDINYNRNKLQQLVRNLNPNYDDILLLLDSDVVVDKYTVSAMIDLLNNSDYICVTSPTQGNTDHLLTACAVIKWEHYELIRFWENMGECQCKKIRNLGNIISCGIDSYEIVR